LNDKINKCIACQSELPVEAKLCSECGSHQRRWRNELKYWASVTGLAAVIVSAIAFTFRFGQEAYFLLFKPEIAISEIDTFGESAIWNLSKSDIWLTTLRIRSSQPTSDLQWGIYKAVKPKESHEFNTTQISKDQWHGDVEQMYSGEKTGNYALDITDNTIKELKNNDMHRDKFVVGFHYTKGPEYLQLKHLYGNRLSTVKCDMEINYVRSIDGKLKSHNIPCEGIVRHLKP
jgi:hypothetical protein